MALPQPINPFDPESSQTQMPNYGLQLPDVKKPSDLAPASSFNPVANPKAPAPASAAFQYLMPAMAGAGAGSQVQPTTSSPSAVMQTIGAGMGGAAAGAALGSVVPGVGTAIGAAGGGLLGVVTGGIQSYFGLKEARAQRRKDEREVARINKLNEEDRAYVKEQNAQSRSDNLEQTRYQRRQNALASQWTAMQTVVNLLNQNMSQDQNLQNLFLERGR